MDAVLVSAVAAALVASLVVLKMYLKLTTGWCRSERQMDGKTVIITGANSGIGKEAARDLARRGARLILACRSLERGNEAARDIALSTSSDKIVVRECDISSLRSVRAFCQEIIRTEPKIDVLILNAGMVPPPGRYLTEDFLELQFATNHLGHFLMANLLLDLLKAGAPARIVVVSSMLHHMGSIDFENLNFEKYTPDPFFTYCKSKLSNILMVKELARRLEGSGVTANALHPGLVRTEINRRTPWYVKNFIQPMIYTWAKDSVAGAQTTIHLSVSEEVDDVSGKYFADCQEVWTSRQCEDRELARRLWEVSELLTGLKSAP